MASERSTPSHYDGKKRQDRTTEERVSRLDSEGKLGEVSRVVSQESESTSGEKRSVVETYSIDVPGTTRDGSLHLVERKTSTESSSSTGERATEQKVEQTNPGDPALGSPRVRIGRRQDRFPDLRENSPQ